MTTITNIIKENRKNRGFTQAQIAEALGLTRTSYIAVEKGTRDLSLQEAEKLGKILGVTVEELYERATPNYPKYRDMVLQMLRNVSGDGKIPKTKLAKLLYLSDFAWFYTNLESMSGMAYRKITYGPVPDQFFRAIDELEEEGLISIDRKSREGREMFLISQTQTGAKSEIDKLSKDEVELMSDIEKKWRSKSTREIVAFAHAQLPYKKAFEGEIVTYALITQENPEDVY